MSEGMTLTKTLDVVKSEVTGPKISFGDIVKTLNHRGFGPLLLAPALITILPTGAIPGVPALSGLFIALVALQILFGRRYPWLPKKLKAFSFKRSQFLYGIKVITPYTEKLDKLVRPRLRFLSASIVKYITAILCAILALLMIIIGFVPFLPAILALPILFFALGLSTKDGLMTLIGFALTLGSAALIGCATGISCIDDRITIGDPVYTRQNSYFIYLDSFPQRDF